MTTFTARKAVPGAEPIPVPDLRWLSAATSRIARALRSARASRAGSWQGNDRTGSLPHRH